MEFGSQEFFERLKAGVAAGDPDVYVDLNNTVEHAVRNLVRSKVKFSDVDDVIQEIQLSVWQRVTTFLITSENNAPSQRNAWLIKVAKSRIIDFINHNYRDRPDQFGDDEPTGGKPAPPDLFRPPLRTPSRWPTTSAAAVPSPTSAALTWRQSGFWPASTTPFSSLPRPAETPGKRVTRRPLSAVSPAVPCPSSGTPCGRSCPGCSLSRRPMTFCAAGQKAGERRGRQTLPADQTGDHHCLQPWPEVRPEETRRNCGRYPR